MYTLRLKHEVVARLREGKNVITPQYILHPLRGQDGKVFFYNKLTDVYEVIRVVERKR